MSRKRFYHIQIWFLDSNLQTSAENLTNYFLDKTIQGCNQALAIAHMYFGGIRSAHSYKYYYDPSRVDETMSKLFPGWPSKVTPKRISHGSAESKWTRQCLEHYNYILAYYRILLEEYYFRFKRSNKYESLCTWFEEAGPPDALVKAKLAKISLPWKNLNPRNRTKDIICGYRTQYFYTLKLNIFLEYKSSQRDIPLWLLEFNEKNIC